MRTKRYFYNEQTLQYEEYKVTARTKVFRAFGILCAILVSSGIIYVLADTYFPSQKEMALMREIDEMKYQYDMLTDEVEVMANELTRIQDRDAEVHRFMFNMDPIDEAIWSAGIGGTDKFNSLTAYPNAGEVMAETSERIDRLSRQLDIQQKSLDTIETMAALRAERIEATPSIKPVRVDLLKKDFSMLSGFGMRMHPIHKVNKMHEGIDFTAPEGTAIQATGTGTIVTVRKSKSGWGRYVVIDHGFDGFRTLYGHMDEIHVKVGDNVVKGQQIGTVGNTGTSTAPHCHYEVHINGRPVDPIHYCLDGLSPKQYQEVVDRARSATQSFD